MRIDGFTFGWFTLGIAAGLLINAFQNWPSQARFGGGGK